MEEKGCKCRQCGGFILPPMYKWSQHSSDCNEHYEFNWMYNAKLTMECKKELYPGEEANAMCECDIRLVKMSMFSSN